MWGRRLGYLASVLGCFAAYLYFNQWAAWVILWWLLALPVLSLCISLPALKTARFHISCPERVTVGERAEAKVQVRCRFPVPVYKCRLRICHCMTGREYTRLRTDHCGAQRISVVSLRVYDYLGLFCRRIKTVDPFVCTVVPVPVPVAALPEMGLQSDKLRPKRGGGFSEEHDLRQYVPGDDLRQIHWKLTAKTGKVVVREPLEQMQTNRLLTVVLSGSEAVIDRKLGRLLWLSQAMLDRNGGHEAAVLTGNGLERFQISSREDLDAMLQKVLSSNLAAVDAAMPEVEEGRSCLTIGGDADG